MTSTVDRAGFQVGINFGSDATLQINGILVVMQLYKLMVNR